MATRNGRLALGTIKLNSSIKLDLIFNCKLWPVNSSRFSIYRHLPRFDSNAASAVTIGNFDGVHCGHQAILRQLCRHAQAHELLPTVLTFSPHPRAFFARRSQRPELIPMQISSLRDKAQSLFKSGIRQMVIMRFNQALADMEADAFVTQFLVHGLNTKWLLVGQDFRFGRRRSGDIELLRELGEKHGFGVQTINDVTGSAGQRISSTSLRQALASGDLSAATRLLGQPFSISGHVVHGQKLGRNLGFPTLNVRVPEHSAACPGIYVARVHGLAAGALDAVASLGKRPSVASDGSLILEAHVLDRHVDAYGKLVCIELLQFLRHEQTFSNLNSLSAAISQDANDARKYFASNGLQKHT